MGTGSRVFVYCGITGAFVGEGPSLAAVSPALGTTPVPVWMTVLALAPAVLAEAPCVASVAPVAPFGACACPVLTTPPVPMV